jgi:hypothetical protein
MFWKIQLRPTTCAPGWNSLRILPGLDLLRLKAIVSVAGWPGPILLHGEQNMFSAPLTLTQWPTGDHRTRIALVTRNLNEACLRELLAILTAAVSAGRPSKTPAIQSHPDRAAG